MSIIVAERFNIMNLFTKTALLLFALYFSACGNDTNPVIENQQTGDYVKIYTAEQGANKFEVWSASASAFSYGYNDIGFKVFVNNTEQNQGFVKFHPVMYHGLGGPNHSTPASSMFSYDAGKSLFTGYVIFMMYDTAAFWTGDFNYNNQAYIDSSIFSINPSSGTLIYSWDNTTLQKTMFLTMISPTAPRVGLNQVEMLLHQTPDLNTYEEISDAEMYIRPWMETMGHGSANNVDPVYTTGGKYVGTVNFNMPGEWFLYDSIKVGGNFITNTPPPKFILEVN